MKFNILSYFLIFMWVIFLQIQVLLTRKLMCTFQAQKCIFFVYRNHSIHNVVKLFWSRIWIFILLLFLEFFFAFPNFLSKRLYYRHDIFFVFIKTLNLLWKPSNWLKIHIAYIPALLLPITNIKWILFINKYEFNNSEFLNLYFFNEKKAYLRDLAVSVSVYFG